MGGYRFPFLYSDIRASATDPGLVTGYRPYASDVSAFPNCSFTVITIIPVDTGPGTGITALAKCVPVNCCFVGRYHRHHGPIIVAGRR